MSQQVLKEGWTRTEGHYFVDGMSLCRMVHVSGPCRFELGDDGDPAKCAACRQEIEAVKNRLRKLDVDVDQICQENPSYSAMVGLAYGLERIRADKRYDA